MKRKKMVVVVGRSKRIYRYNERDSSDRRIDNSAQDDGNKNFFLAQETQLLSLIKQLVRTKDRLMLGQ